MAGAFLSGIKSANDWKKFDTLKALKSILTWDQTQLLEKLIPSNFITPLGRKIKVTYENELPKYQYAYRKCMVRKFIPKVEAFPSG